MNAGPLTSPSFCTTQPLNSGTIRDCAANRSLSLGAENVQLSALLRMKLGILACVRPCLLFALLRSRSDHPGHAARMPCVAEARVAPHALPHAHVVRIPCTRPQDPAGNLSMCLPRFVPLPRRWVRPVTQGSGAAVCAIACAQSWTQWRLAMWTSEPRL